MSDDRKSMEQLQNKVDGKIADEEKTRQRPKNVATWRTEKPAVMNNGPADFQPKKEKPKKNQPLMILAALLMAFGGIMLLAFNEDRVMSAYQYITGDYSWQRVHHADEDLFRLSDGNYVQASVTIEVEERGQVRRLNSQDGSVDHIIEEAFMTVDTTEIRSNPGKDQVVNEISAMIDRDIDGVAVKEVYFRSILSPLAN